MKQDKSTYDYVIIGSGFGGSVCALRLVEKGYSVLVIEKGKWYKSGDFPKTNWNLRKWLWEPRLKFHGIFKMTFLKHVTILSGVGVGGGSLTYANTLPVPKQEFFTSGSWAELEDWEEVLKPYYDEAYRMLGAEINPYCGPADDVIRSLAADIGRSDHYSPSKVGVYFGKAGVTVSDPYFDGKGPDRTGCIQCGACMTGCRHDAKNTLDKNYLYLAQQLGVKIKAENEVIDVKPIDGKSGANGYQIYYKRSTGRYGRRQEVKAGHVIFAGGVLGTVPLLLKLKKNGSLPGLSDMLGCQVRTNNESLMVVTSTRKDHPDYTEGIAIGSILDIDKHSHLEPVRYGKGSGFFRLLTIPYVQHVSAWVRLPAVLFQIMKQPIRFLKTTFSLAYSKRSVILLFMQTLDSTLRLKSGIFRSFNTETESGPSPRAYIPEAAGLAEAVGKKLNGIPYANFYDILKGTSTTAHILGGAVMGSDPSNGVIDKNNKVFGYDNMMICDGSMISANPGVNPSLSIAAISELTMSKIPVKNA